MDSNILILLVLVLLVYMVIRQFTEQRVNLVSLLLLPLLSAYAGYVELLPAFRAFTPLSLIGGMLVGVIVGVLTGIIRGRNTRVRLDEASGVVFSKPLLASSLLWLGLLVARISVVILNYSSLKHFLLAGIIVAFACATFFVSVVTQKFMVFQQYNRFQVNGLQQLRGQRNF